MGWDKKEKSRCRIVERKKNNGRKMREEVAELMEDLCPRARFIIQR